MMRVLIVGVGRMGFAHAKAAATFPDVEICGLVARDFQKWPIVKATFPDARLYNDFQAALAEEKPDAVIISSYTDTHALYSTLAMEAGAHVFVEKPLGLTRREAGYTITKARETNKKMIVGLILRHDAIWKTFIELARSHVPPLTFKANCNQHSTGKEWQLHQDILNAGLSPLVDCGIHYIDVMNQICDGEVTDIDTTGERQFPEIPTINNTKMIMKFSDGSVFNFESGFGPKIDPYDKPIRRIESSSGIISITEDNCINNNGHIIRFSADVYDKSILEQQKYFFTAIKDDINLDEHWISVALCHAMAFAAEEEMKIV
jgi:predicted dehydrogenase